MINNLAGQRSFIGHHNKMDPQNHQLHSKLIAQVGKMEDMAVVELLPMLAEEVVLL